MGCGKSVEVKPETTTEGSGLHNLQGPDATSDSQNQSQVDGLELLRMRMKTLEEGRKEPNADVSVSSELNSSVSGGPESFTPTRDFDPSCWKKEKLLGRGAFGTVYRATNSEGEYVAVKTISFSEADPNVMKCLQLLQRELRTLRKVGDHPNIIQYYKSTRAQTSVHMFMEYCSGGSLKARYSQEGAFSTSLAGKYTSNIVNGLNCLHEQDIVHRDIKCDNILLNDKDVAKLADFGASTILGEAAQHTRIGTVYWMAPEVLIQTGHRWQADIWSVGCTLMEMMTAARPFAHACKNQEAFFELLSNTSSSPSLPQSISDDLPRAFLEVCLQKARDSRPKASQLMVHPFVSTYEALVPATVSSVSN